MISNIVGIVLLISVCGIAAPGAQRAVDCRKFVFAPICRGVSKRHEVLSPGKPEPPLYIDQTSLKDIAQSIYTEMALAKAKDEEDENTIKSINKLERDRDGDETETEYRKLKRNTPLYRLLLWSKKINSDLDNVPVQEFETL